MDRHKRRTLAGIGLLVISVLSGSLSGEETAPAVTGSAALGIFNRYIFRGYRLGADSPVFQPALSLSYKGFSATFWGNIDMREKATPCFIPDRPGQKSFNETDLTLAYSATAGEFSLTAGFIYYGTKYTTETQELYVGAGWNVFGKPTLTIYQDIDAYPGTYFLFTLAQSFPLAKGVILDLGGSAAYFLGEGAYWRTFNETEGAYAGDKYRAFHDGMIKAGLTFPLGTNLGLQALLQCYFPLSKASSKTIGGSPYNINGNLATILVFGVNLTYSF